MDIRKTYELLKAELESIDAEAAVFLKEAKELNDQVQPLLAKQREFGDKVKELRGPDYAAKRKLLGQMAVSLGGKALKAEPMK